ncbi:hypothetical protein AX17_000100 [Amanita inopinata Kibby_2008]|nr:hypothetical protein AX17_000100 [Amanita inopinata Kibby_2008]
MESKGASNNERLLAAARSDNEDMLLEVFDAGDFDINCKDGLGNTALHLAASHGSTDVLEYILSYEDCDVDPINTIERATPLHLALQLEDAHLREHVVESLLDAGADTSYVVQSCFHNHAPQITPDPLGDRIRNKRGQTALETIPMDDPLRVLFRKVQATASISHDDIASDDEDEYSGSEED